MIKQSSWVVFMKLNFDYPNYDFDLISSSPFTELRSSSCGNPGVPPKGVLSGTKFDIGDKIQYSCVTGYILDGHPLLTCIANSANTASWDFPVPICRGRFKWQVGQNKCFKILYVLLLSR